MKRCYGWNLFAILCCLCVFTSSAAGQNVPELGPTVVTPQSGNVASPPPTREPTPEELEELRAEQSQPDQLNYQKDVIGSGSGSYFVIQCPTENSYQQVRTPTLDIYVCGTFDQKKVGSWGQFPDRTTMGFYFPDERKDKTAPQPLDLSLIKPLVHLQKLHITPSYWHKKPAVITDQLDSIAGHSELSELDIVSCVITPQAARNIASNPKLARLLLFGCQFEGDALSEFKSMPSLVCLELQRSTFSDDSLRALEACPKLRHLNIQETKATIKAFSPFKGWPALEGLDISRTNIEGDQVTELGKCKKLKVLSTCNLKLTPGQIRTIAKNPSVRQIAVSNKIDWKALKEDLAKKHIEIVPIEDREILTTQDFLGDSSDQEKSMPKESVVSLRLPAGLATAEDHRALRAFVDLQGDRKCCEIYGISPKNFQAEDFAIFDAADRLVLDFTVTPNTASYSAPLPPVQIVPGANPVAPAQANETPPDDKAFLEFFANLSRRPLEKSRVKELEIHSFFLELKPNSFDFLRKLTSLEALAIDNAGMNDQTAEMLVQLPHLQRLRINSKNITDKAVEKLAKSESIEFLDISSTAATDACIKHLAKFKNLKEVHCYYTTIALDKCKALEEKGIAVKGGQNGNMMNWEKYKPKHSGIEL